MKKLIGRIRENDEQDDKIVKFYAVKHTEDGETGYRLEASNGDDVGYHRIQSLDKVKQDMRGSWDRWDTFEEAN